MILKKILPLLIILSILAMLCGCSGGADGKSAYEIAVDNGFIGSEADWLASLAGKDAPSNVPEIGPNGNWWVNGEDTGVKAEGDEIINNTLKDPAFADKKIVCIGDDLFGKAGAGASVAAYIEDLTGADVKNVSLAGATMAKNPTTALDDFSMYKIAEAMASKNYSAQKSAASALNNANLSAAISDLEKIDFNKIDILVICFGVNDYLGGVPLTSSNAGDMSAYSNALNHVIEQICGKYTKMQVYVTTPLYCGFGDKEDSDSKLGAAGSTLKEYADTAVATAKAAKVPVVDNYNELGINKINLLYYYNTNTSIVPNRNAMKLIARHIAKAFF